MNLLIEILTDPLFWLLAVITVPFMVAVAIDLVLESRAKNGKRVSRVK